MDHCEGPIHGATLQLQVKDPGQRRIRQDEREMPHIGISAKERSHLSEETDVQLQCAARYWET